jgi:hypothetical protein
VASESNGYGVIECQYRQAAVADVRAFETRVAVGTGVHTLLTARESHRCTASVTI